MLYFRLNFISNIFHVMDIEKPCWKLPNKACMYVRTSCFHMHYNKPKQFFLLCQIKQYIIQYKTNSVIYKFKERSSNLHMYFSFHTHR